MYKRQVKNSPNIDTDKPVSRQEEIRYHGYYDYPYYWGGTGLWGLGAYPGMMLSEGGYSGADAGDLAERAEHARMTREAAEHQNDDPHLRSGNAVMNYHIEATDGGIGHVQGPVSYTHLDVYKRQSATLSSKPATGSRTERC